jgi:type IV pilus assembly protein PilW
MGLPVQGYAAASLTAAPTPPASCSAWLPAANLAPGSDILVVRRANTDFAAIGSAITAGEHYIQANPSEVEVQVGASGTIQCDKNASGGAATIVRRCMIPAAIDVCSATCDAGTTPAAFVRKYEVHVYFVAPCNVPSGGGSICTGATDDNGRPIPTLKRLELSAGTFRVVALAEGVEYMKVSYGIDDAPLWPPNPPGIHAETGEKGDGSPDGYFHAPTVAQFGDAVTARVDLLVRNPEPSSGYSDPKTYRLGVADGATATAAFAITPSQPQYRRHAYSSEIRLVNLGGRKEIP